MSAYANMFGTKRSKQRGGQGAGVARASTNLEQLLHSGACAMFRPSQTRYKNGFAIDFVVRPNRHAMVFQWLSRQHYRYNLWTGLYMLDPWERALYSTFRPPSQVFGVGDLSPRLPAPLRTPTICVGTAFSIVLVRPPRIHLV